MKISFPLVSKKKNIIPSPSKSNREPTKSIPKSPQSYELRPLDLLGHFAPQIAAILRHLLLLYRYLLYLRPQITLYHARFHRRSLFLHSLPQDSVSSEISLLLCSLSFSLLCGHLIPKES
ncbi:hypothetical protein Tsubulata_030189 [Turnera subulata]|uniref:Uncharacterized protein n=1 Tax=Turnera subulata TaxID=218843 RepID=A0A9Q0GIS3_9ROSI|nr:hypothetical protein Tsubulata_030189 [Turnera subulata]